MCSPLSRGKKMPRKDPTFSGRDVIRLWQNNLTVAEQAEVACFFVDILPLFFGLPADLPQGILRQIAEGIVGLLPFGGTAVQIVEVVESLKPTLRSRCEFFKRTGVVITSREVRLRLR